MRVTEMSEVSALHPVESGSAESAVIKNTARRTFLRGLGKVGTSATAALLFGDMPLATAQSLAANQDSVNQILTAALVAEDLATTFYYNALVGEVVQNARLAGAGGTAIAPTSTGQSVANLLYLRAALGQEVAHANLLRAAGNLTSGPGEDPYQTFYFNPAVFSTFLTFINTLEALENIFIGAYLTAVRELASLAARSAVRGVPAGQFGAAAYSSTQTAYFAQVAASICGVECEHRALVRVVGQIPPAANNLYFEQTAGVKSVYHGKQSAVAALAPYLTPGINGTQAYSLATALQGLPSVVLQSSPSNPPAQ